MTPDEAKRVMREVEEAQARRARDERIQMNTPGEVLDHTPLSYGIYTGKTPNDIAERDPDYLCWAYEEWTPKPCSELLYRECLKDVAESNRQRRVERYQAED